ncbi:MAG TPA: PAS domain S-box protein, partial [Nitrospiraceae bacterium]|nr:PAS domain S-box protein [Nitrospiraceae bacterium]
MAKSIDKTGPARTVSSKSFPAQDVMRATLDALPSPAAILDESGTILLVNTSWRRFAKENGHVESRYGVGSNYLTVCRSTTGPDAKVAQQVAHGIEEVITGKEAHFSYEYPCPTAKQCFRLHVAHLDLPIRPVRVLVVHENITSLKLAEETLSVVEERFQQLLDTTDVLAWEADGETWQFTYVGPQAPKLFGYPVEQWYQKNFWIDHLDPRDRKDAVEFCLKHSQVDQQYDFQYRMVAADGRVVWVDDFVSVLTESGRPKTLRGFMVDITQRKRTEEALRESEEEWRAVFEHNPTMYFMVDAAGSVLSVNPFGAAQLGYTVNELVGHSVLNVFYEADRDAVQRNVAICLDHLGQSMSWEFRKVRKDGSVLWVRETAKAVLTGKDQPIILIVCEDITDRKRSEDALRESEERFRLMADAAPVMVWMSGPDKRCTYFNKGWLDFTGRPIEQELGDGWAENVHPDDLEKCLETYVQAFDARKDLSMEYRLRRADGEYRWIWDIGVPRFDGSGEFAGYIGSCVDLTDRKRVESALQELSGRLITAQEEERSRIGRELHDDVNQRLALLAIELEQLQQQPPSSTAQLIERSHGLWQKVREISTDLHHLSHELHPSKLDHLGLGTAVRSFCNELTR